MRTREEGVKKANNFAAIISGSSLSGQGACACVYLGGHRIDFLVQFLYLFGLLLLEAVETVVAALQLHREPVVLLQEFLLLLLMPRL